LEYARSVVSGSIPACRWTRLACQRFLSDTDRTDWPYHFVPEKAERACKFAELFPHVKGHWAIPDPRAPEKVKIHLEPWQCFVRANIHGFREKDTGFRRFRKAYVEVPRKNGKSVLGAVEGLDALTEGEPGAEVYSGATTEKQAWEVFRPAKLMAQRSPEFLSHFGITVNASNLVRLDTGDRFEVLIGNPGDGASPSLAIVDEYHEHPDARLYDTMVTGMGARRQPLVLVITTAGSDISGPCYAMHEDVQKMLDGTNPDDRLFGVIWSIDEGDDWAAEESLRKANPNYGVSVSESFLKEKQAEAVASSRHQNVFKTKHLNVWVTARAAWMNMEWWHRQADRSLRPERFADCPCFAGGDLASKLDIASIVRVFRQMVDDVPHYYAFGRHYLPESTVNDPRNTRYLPWAHDGWLTVTDGDMTDYSRIRDDLLEDARAHGIEQAAFDPWASQEMIQELTREGITAIELQQNVKNLSDPMKSLEALVKSGQFHHNGDPVLAWAMSNVTVKEDANDNIFPRKERPENKIDPASALINAMSRAILIPEEASWLL
jgi:phage terminase large subunit-like protein